MPTNPYINNYDTTSEQNLYEDLIIEAIQFYGRDMYYLPWTQSDDYDEIYGEDPKKKFNDAYIIEMYIKNVEGFEGERDLVSKFGLEIRDETTLTVAIRRFEELLGENPGMGSINIVRPREGDLVFIDFIRPNPAFPDANGLFLEIMHVEDEQLFFELGSLKTYDLRCEAFRYSSEEFNTGIDVIDRAFSNSTSQFVLTGNAMPNDTTSDNTRIENEAADILDLSQDSPFGDFS